MPGLRSGRRRRAPRRTRARERGARARGERGTMRNAPRCCESARSIEGGIGAEEAWQQRRNAEAELMETARRWAVVKAASALLGGALDRHRAARRDPLMTRAGAIFSLLTGGAFGGLDQAFGDDDEPELVAVRRGGENVRVKALSEGTRDQLYLALRLAVIESYAARVRGAAVRRRRPVRELRRSADRRRARSARGDRRPGPDDPVHPPSACRGRGQGAAWRLSRRHRDQR